MACQFYTLHISILHVKSNEGRGIVHEGSQDPTHI